MNIVKDISIPINDWIISQVTDIIRKKTQACFPEQSCIELALLDWLAFEKRIVRNNTEQQIK